MSTHCNKAVLSFFAKPDVSKLHMLSMRQGVQFVLLFCFYLWNRGHPGVCYIWLYSLEIMVKHMGLTESILCWWAGNKIHHFGEHHFCSHWLSGPYNTERNKRSKPVALFCLSWKADELFSASLGAFQWLLLWSIQAASTKIEPSASSHACK